VDDLFVDPVPTEQRHRMTMAQFGAIYSAAPRWMQWLMTLALHLALRRVDLVNRPGRAADIYPGTVERSSRNIF
jgi:hypothetical protein